MVKDDFLEASKRLNSEQKKAVDAIEGPVLVIAGPGTGKTEILTLRIVNILRKTDVSPENVLALTFTESATRAMRERLLMYIGERAYRISIFTFHGFANHIIQHYPEYFPRIVGGKNIADIDRITLIEKILTEGSFEAVRPIGNPTHYIKPLLGEITEMKREHITPSDLEALIKADEDKLSKEEQFHTKGAHKGKTKTTYSKLERTIKRHKELLLVYIEYEKGLEAQNVFDYEDMIIECVKALETHEDLLLELQEMYQYIHADEHQDVNRSQNKILELLTNFHASPNIFVVGDEKQAIYRFQGASLENFLYFEDVYKDTVVIPLIQNYRSGQDILDVAHTLITANPGPSSELRVPLHSQNNGSGSVSYTKFPHTELEHTNFIEEIGKLIEKQVSPSEIAVILRTNNEVRDFARQLREKKIDVSVHADTDLLYDPYVMQALDLLTTLVHRENEVYLSRLLHAPYVGITPSDLVKLFRARTFDTPLSSLITSKKHLETIGIEDVASILSISKYLGILSERMLTHSPVEVAYEAMYMSGLISHARGDVNAYGKLRRLFNEMEQLLIADHSRSLRDVVMVLESLKTHEVPLTAPMVEAEGKEGVSVMTAHKSKGLEFDYVFIPHVTDNSWGKRRKASLFSIPYTKKIKETEIDVLDDERRLLYVALTRARKSVILGSSQVSIDGRAHMPSLFVEEMNLSSVDKKVESKDSVFHEQEVEQSEHVAIDVKVLEKLFYARGLSVTALNNYLRSPWEFFYRNFLRLPEPQQIHLIYGNVLHAVMRRVGVFVRDERKLPHMNIVTSWLTRELDRQPITNQVFTQLKEKGVKALVGYLKKEGGGFAKKAEYEFNISVSLPGRVDGEKNVPLRGILDRMDIHEDGTVSVYDYKTGVPKTRRYIEGKTKDSDGSYKRQLVFYKLLLDLYGDERYTFKEGTLSFLEPDARGNYKNETFVIEESEVKELKDIIFRVTKEITNGSFLEEPCSEETSSYCDLVAMLRGR